MRLVRNSEALFIVEQLRSSFSLINRPTLNVRVICRNYIFGGIEWKDDKVERARKGYKKRTIQSNGEAQSKEGRREESSESR